MDPKEIFSDDAHKKAVEAIENIRNDDGAKKDHPRIMSIQKPAIE